MSSMVESEGYDTNANAYAQPIPTRPYARQLHDTPADPDYAHPPTIVSQSPLYLTQPLHRGIEYAAFSPNQGPVMTFNPSPSGNNYQPTICNSAGGFRFGSHEQLEPVNHYQFNPSEPEPAPLSAPLPTYRDSPKNRAGRKTSLQDGARRQNPYPGRAGHGRAVSQDDIFAPEPKLSVITTPGETYANANAYTMSMPRSAVSWGGQSATPGLFNQGYSYPGSMDPSVIDSPETPAMPVEDTFKRQKRRECHNQVEKRRREHINGKIEELGKLLPARYAEEAAQAEEDEEENRGSSKKKKKRPNPNTKQPRDAAQCKGRILSQSVKYIYELQHIQDMQNARIRQLESILASSGQIAPSAPPQYQHYIWNQPTHSTPIRRDSVAASPLAPAPTYFQPYPGMPRPMMHHIPKTTEDHHLEVMQPSPDPDATTRSNNSSWSGGNIHPASLTTSTSTSFSEGSGPHHIYSPEDAGLISGSSGSSPEQHLAHMVQKTGPTNQQPTEGLGLEVGLGPLDIEGHTVCWQN